MNFEHSTRSNYEIHHKRLSLVIGSGGARCAAAIGVHQVLQQAGIQVNLFVGASGGSIYAAGLALGMDSDTLAARTQELWTGELLQGYTSNLRAAMSGELHFSTESGLVDDTLINQALRQSFGDALFSDVQAPLFIAASDLLSGEPVLLMSGAIFDAVRASVAIPLIIPPWKINGQLLVDGAVSDPFPIDIAIREGADIILGVGFELPIRTRLRSYIALNAHFNNLYINNLFRAAFAFHNLVHHAEIISILPEFPSNIGTFSEDHIQVIQSGAAAMREQLPYLQSLLESPGVNGQGKNP